MGYGHIYYGLVLDILPGKDAVTAVAYRSTRM
jgi:hypothetical protein